MAQRDSSKEQSPPATRQILRCGKPPSAHLPKRTALPLHRESCFPLTTGLASVLNPIMDLVISIVSWNTRELLKKCLASLQSNTDPARVGVTVIDNASKDGSSEMVTKDFPGVTLVNSGGNLGFGRAHNLIRGHVKAPFVLFLNPDTEFTEPAHERLIAFLQNHPEVGAVGCRMTYPDGTVQPLGVQWFPTPFRETLALMLLSNRTRAFTSRFLPSADPHRSAYVSKIYGGCLMVRTELLDRIGWFDERFFMYGEDVDLCRRIADAGYRLYYMSEVWVVHLVGGASKRTTSNFPSLMKCESIAKLMEKYYGSRGWLLYRMGVFLGSSLRLMALLTLRFFSLVRLSGVPLDFRPAFSKYSATLQWSLKLRQPIITK
jgi:hypothetical protein